MQEKKKKPTHAESTFKKQSNYSGVLGELQHDTQKFELLRYLIKNNSITPTEAWNALGIYRLSGRIYELRQLGVAIVTLRCEVTDRHGERKTVAKYVLDRS